MQGWTQAQTVWTWLNSGKTYCFPWQATGIFPYAQKGCANLQPMTCGGGGRARLGSHPFPPSNNLSLWRHHTPSCWAGIITLKWIPVTRAAVFPHQVSCAPHSGLSHSQDLILNITPGSGQPPLLQSSLPSPSHAHRAVPGDGWHILLLPGQKSHQHSPPDAISELPAPGQAGSTGLWEN